MLRKKEVYTNITPIPRSIPRQLAIDMLHSHGEVITLNPLVLDHQPIPAPRDTPADEYYATWYEITERIQYIPGVGKLGSGLVKFRGCFHDMPWGLQTHVLVPGNIDIRNKWRIAGNQPGEPPETRELGIDVPADGLYLREDIEIKCNIGLVGFVKAQLKAASKVLVDRFVKKAELLDAGALQAMMENGRMKTFNPADRSSVAPPPPGSPTPSNLPSPRMPYQMPTLNNSGFASSPGQGYQKQEYQAYGPPPQYAQGSAFELPGDFQPLGSPPPHSHSPHLHPQQAVAYEKRYSSGSNPSSYPSPGLSPRWSEYSSNTRPTSYSSNASNYRSPGLDQKGFVAELPAMDERVANQPEPRYPYGPDDPLHN